MQRVINTVEKNIRTKPIKAIVVAANIATDVLADLLDVQKGEQQEVCWRSIQNVGANPCFYAFGQDCDATENFQGQMQAGQQLNCSNHGERVSVFSPLGTTIAITLLRRLDLHKFPNIIPPNNP